MAHLLSVPADHHLGHARPIRPPPPRGHLLPRGLVKDGMQGQLNRRQQHPEAIRNLPDHVKIRADIIISLKVGRRRKRSRRGGGRPNSDEEVESDQGVGSPADPVEEGGEGQAERQELHALRVEHELLKGGVVRSAIKAELEVLFVYGVLRC